VLVEHGQVALSERLVVSGHGEAPSFSSDASTTSNESLAMLFRLAVL